jgi:ATPase subunit of ABC transporter with duplicated ATPase domains
VPSPASLIARGVRRTHGPVVVLDGIDLTVGPRSRIGLVGPNGAGKTTLLRALAGIEPLDAGTVKRTPPSATVGYLPQEPERRAGETLREHLRRRTGVADAEAALEATAAALGSGGDADEYTTALDTYLSLGGPDLDARTGAVCDDLALPVALLDSPITALSGGEAARASLAALLLSRFDVFLLDEPTNDLDLAGLDRLERWVHELESGLVVVSHDRAFLDRTITSVVPPSTAAAGRPTSTPRRRRAATPRRRTRPTASSGTRSRSERSVSASGPSRVAPR